MTGYLLTCDHETWQLPKLLQWEVERTDGESCDACQIRFLYEPERLEQLKKAVRLRLVEEGKTVFFGVVDEVSVTCNEKGRVVTLCSRGLQALLMDNQLTAQRFETLQIEDAINKFVLPFGVEKIRRKSLPPVRNFATETGNTAWQALRGFCRHSCGAFPRFTADGTLLFEAEEGAQRPLSVQNKVLRAELSVCRYGLVSRQIIVTAAEPEAEVQENPHLMELGVSCQKVNLQQGTALKADWQTARQRLLSSAREALQLTLLLAENFTAIPGDRVAVELPTYGLSGNYLLRSVSYTGSAEGTSTKLVLEGEL